MAQLRAATTVHVANPSPPQLCKSDAQWLPRSLSHRPHAHHLRQRNGRSAHSRGPGPSARARLATPCAIGILCRFCYKNRGGASRNQRSSSAMCDYSLHHVKSRPAKVGDKLRTVNFNTGTRGFASPDDRTTAVCVLPGTELAFSEELNWVHLSSFTGRGRK